MTVVRRFFDWLDARSGFRSHLAPIRNRVLPNGPSWSYTSASCLLWLFVIQLVTGLLLMTTYSPSTNSAWASVHFIEQTAAGSFIRGLHHFTSHAMIVLFGIHVVRVLLAGAFRPPRELVWITGLVLIPLFLVWSITGNPLSAGQKGVAQIEVEGNILGSTPVIGRLLRQILIGGDEVGNLTLTHLYFLHVGLLPLLVIGLLTVHVTQVYRHGLSATDSDTGANATPYWPHQTVRNLLVLAAVFGAIAMLAWRRGAPLDAPADADFSSSPRPEWYFRWIFELRRHFTGEWEFVATLVIPAAVLIFFLTLPALDRLCSRPVSAILRTAVVLAGLGGWGWLTWTSFDHDRRDAEFLASERQAHELANRARTLAGHRSVPHEGAAALLRDDPKTQGPLIFARHCASCHAHVDPAGNGIAAADTSAPNLFGIGRAEWIAGFLDPDRITGEHYFGKTALVDGDMATRVAELFDGKEGDKLITLRQQLAQVALALSAEAALPSQTESDRAAADEIALGRELLVSRFQCTDCHRFHDEGELGQAPDLTGYGSREWITSMISDPTAKRFYSDDRNDRMPSFAKDAIHAENNLLSPRELRLLVDWLRGDWFEPQVQPATTSPGPVSGLANR
jgi:ubiquinol-cytochrome c reductase cytochrome b subunit